MKKRILSLMLVMCIIASLMTGLTLTASAATSGTCGDNITWILDDGTLTISGSGDMKKYESPWRSHDIKTVIIEQGVTNIGSGAFEGCTGITSVKIPNTIKSIGNGVFSGCNSLANVNIPNSVTEIGDNAFRDCTSITSMTIPNNVTDIGYAAFYGCNSLTCVIIPDSVTNIKDSTFSDCVNLTSATIPDSVTSIGRYAFYKCSNLTNVTIPDSVTSIGWYAFSRCNNLTNVTIPDSVTHIDKNAFFLCSSLTSVTLGNSLTSVAREVFSGCSSLTSVTIPNSVTYIDYYAFSDCNSLTSVTMPDSITNIQGGAFKGCTNLTDVYYSGSEEQWERIAIGANNECLTNAIIHYNNGETGSAEDSIESDFGNATTLPNRIELSSTRPSMSVTEGESFEVMASVYENNEKQGISFGISFAIEDKSIADIVDSETNGHSAVIKIKGKSAGTTTLKVNDSKRNLMTTADITVSPKHNNTYTIYTVPTQWVDYFSPVKCNFYNFAGLFIDSYEKTVKSNGSCSISFDVYNRNYTYGIVEVYDENGYLKDAVIIDKWKDNNTSIKESLWDNSVNLIHDFNIFDDKEFSYKNKTYSKETNVTLDNVPVDGYVKITSSPKESLLLCIINELDIILSTQDSIEKIAGFGKSTDVKLFQNIARKLLDEKEFLSYKEEFKDGLKDLFVDGSKDFLKGVGDEFVVNANSIGSFVETMKNNLGIIDWEGLLVKSAVGTGISFSENTFEGIAGMAGVALKGCFALGSTANLICECNDFVNLRKASSICIQVPEDNTRTFKRVRVQCAGAIDRETSLNVYKIVGTDYDILSTIKSGTIDKSELVEYINISLIKAGEESQLTSTATVSIPISEEMQQYMGKIKVYRVEEDGSLTNMNAKTSKWHDYDYLEFETNHFSIYAIVAEGDTGKPTTSFGSEVSEWAKEEVEEAYDENLVPEILVGKDLTQKVDRAEFAAISVALYENLSGNKATKSSNPFNDIYGNACEDDILKAYNLDITTGTSATTFDPNTNITREQMATMLTRAYKKSEFKDWTIAKDDDYPLNFMGVRKFADDNEISDYAKESVYFMARWDIIKGVGDNKFAPKNSATLGESYGYATREQAVIIALRSAKHL